MGLLDAAWKQCFFDLGAPVPPARIFEGLLARYREPHRAYHTTRHLEECFGWFGQARHLMQGPGYHDAIYDTHASDNELRSAQLATDVFEMFVCGTDARAIGNLISATALHSTEGAGSEIKIMLDIDLSILGAARERFDEYERQVRFEYSWVAPDAFRDGRTKVLRQFLDRPAIFSTPFFHERLEAPARENLERSLATLAHQ